MSDSRRSCPNIRPVTDWGQRFRPYRSDWTETRFRSGKNCARPSPVVHTERFLGCNAYHVPGGKRNLLRYDPFFPARHVATFARTHGESAADHLRSSRAQACQAMLLTPFTPDAMKKLEPRVRAICNELIDGVHCQMVNADARRATPAMFRSAPSRTCRNSEKTAISSSSDSRHPQNSASRMTTR